MTERNRLFLEGKFLEKTILGVGRRKESVLSWEKGKNRINVQAAKACVAHVLFVSLHLLCVTRQEAQQRDKGEMMKACGKCTSHTVLD